MYGRVGRIWHVSRTGLQFAKLHARKRPSRNQLTVTVIQALTDQCPTTHSSRIVNCPPRTCLFQSLSIKELTFDYEFKVVNALVIDHRWLWGLEIPTKVSIWDSWSFSSVAWGEGTGRWQWRTCLMPWASLESNANRSQPILRSVHRRPNRSRETRHNKP